MTLALWCLLVFVLWTMSILAFGVGVSRVRAIARGELSIEQIRSEVPQLSERYQRIHRAHLNCLETLPLFATVVLVGHVTGVRSHAIDVLAAVLMTARVVQSLAHIHSMKGPAARIRVAAYFVQPPCVLAMTALIAAHHLAAR